MYLPTEDEIQAKAETLGLLDKIETSSESRKSVVQTLLNEQAKQPAKEDDKQLLSRTSTKVDSGTLVVELWHIKENRA